MVTPQGGEHVHTEDGMLKRKIGDEWHQHLGEVPGATRANRHPPPQSQQGRRS